MSGKEVVEEKSKHQGEKLIDEPEDGADDDGQIFPQRLHSVLADERNHDAICWLPHGRAFIIRDRALFAEHVMPKFFPRKSKYSSFTRKLNRWNFSRVSSGPEIGAYYHEFFLREKPHLAAQMFCKNARSKIAMDSPDPSPASVLSSSQYGIRPAVQQQAQTDPDVARSFLTNQQMDPAMQFLVEQQLALGQQHLNSLRVQQNPIAASLALELHIRKKQQERLLQLQQMIALNKMQGQKKRLNAYRASAA